MSSIFEKEEDLMACNVGESIKIVRGKWTMPIIYYLSFNTLRFSELKRKMPYITEANLTKELRQLEEFNMINRKVYAQIPPKVEYSLTEKGKKFLLVMKSIEEFSNKF